MIVKLFKDTLINTDFIVCIKPDASWGLRDVRVHLTDGLEVILSETLSVELEKLLASIEKKTFVDLTETY